MPSDQYTLFKGYYHNNNFYEDPSYTPESRIEPSDAYTHYLDKNTLRLYVWSNDKLNYLKVVSSYNGYYRNSKFYPTSSGGSPITPNPNFLYYIAKNTKKVYLWNYTDTNAKYIEFAYPIYLSTHVKHGKEFDDLLMRLYNYNPKTWAWTKIPFSSINTTSKLSVLEKGNYVITDITSYSNPDTVKEIFPIIDELGYVPETINLIKFTKLNTDLDYIIDHDNSIDPIYNYPGANTLVILPNATYLGKRVKTSSSPAVYEYVYHKLYVPDNIVISSNPPDNPDENTYWISPRRLSGSSTPSNPIYVDEYNIHQYVNNTWKPMTLADIPDTNYINSKILDPLDKREDIKVYFDDMIATYVDIFEAIESHIEPDWHHAKSVSSKDTNKSEKEYWNSKMNKEDAIQYLNGLVTINPNGELINYADALIAAKIPSGKIGELYNITHQLNTDADDNHFKNLEKHYGLSLDENGRVKYDTQSNFEFRANERIYKIDYNDSADMWLNTTYTNSPYSVNTIITPDADKIKIGSNDYKEITINESKTVINYEVGRPFHSGNTWYDDFQYNNIDTNNEPIINRKFYKINNPDNVNTIRIFNEEDNSAHAINYIALLKDKSIINTTTTTGLFFTGAGKPKKILSVLKTMNRNDNKIMIYASYDVTVEYTKDGVSKSYVDERGLLYISSINNHLYNPIDITDYVPGGRTNFGAHHHISVIEDMFVMDYKNYYVYTKDGYTWYTANIIPFIGVTNFFNPENYSSYGTYFAVTEDHHLLACDNDKMSWNTIYAFADDELCSSIMKIEDNIIISTTKYNTDNNKATIVQKNLYRYSENKLTLVSENATRIEDVNLTWYSNYGNMIYSIAITKGSSKSSFKIYFSINGINYGYRNINFYDSVEDTTPQTTLTNSTNGYIVYKEKIDDEYYLILINRDIKVSSNKYSTSIYSIKLSTIFGEEKDLVEMKLLKKEITMNDIIKPSSILDYHIEDALNKYIYYTNPTESNPSTVMESLFTSAKPKYQELSPTWNKLYRSTKVNNKDINICKLFNEAILIMKDFYERKTYDTITWNDNYKPLDNELGGD